MTTLTEEKDLVKRLNGVAPQPAHYLVVFKKMEEGKRFRACVAPGERFKKAIWESSESFVAFAVPSDLNLRHRFQRTYKSHDLLHSFVLNLTLDYWVSNPETLVEKLGLDPLKRLEEEVDLLLEQRKKSVDWVAIEREQTDLADVLFNSPGFGHTLEQLSAFASTQGLGVRRVAVTRDLPSHEISVATKEIEAAREASKLNIEHQVDQLKQHHRHELQGQEDNFTRRKAVADGITDNLNRGVSQATDTIRTFSDLQRAVNTGIQIQTTLAGGAGGAAHMTTPALEGSAVAGALPAHTDPSACDRKLSAISTTVGDIACDLSDRRHLLSTCLHIAAEALRGDNASEETLTQYTGVLDALLTKLVPLLNTGQVKFLRSFKDTAALRRELT